MKKLQLFGLTIALALATTSCEKDVINDPNPVTPTPSGLSGFFDNNVSSRKQHFTVNASTGGTVVGQQGTTITIFAGMLHTANGNVATGNVDIELIEVYDRGTMALLNKPTRGRLPSGDKATLVSKGEYYLRITQNGQALQPGNGVMVKVPANNIPGTTDGMSLFLGEIIGNDLTWVLNDTVEAGQDSTGMSYTILEGEWGWTNVDRFYSDPRPKTVLKARLPDGYNPSNTEVFLAYEGEPGALASLDNFTTDGYFSEHYGQIPIGLNVHFITVTMINGQLNYSIHSATITAGHIEYISDFAPITQSELADLINDLP